MNIIKYMYLTFYIDLLEILSIDILSIQGDLYKQIIYPIGYNINIVYVIH